MPRTYTRYTPAQKQLVKAKYHLLSNRDLAQLLHTTPEKVRALAQRMGIKWRAENGAPRWRPRKQVATMPWAVGSRWV